MWFKVPDDARSDYSEPLWRGTPIIEDYTHLTLEEFKANPEKAADYYLRKTGVNEVNRTKIENILKDL